MKWSGEKINDMSQSLSHDASLLATGTPNYYSGVPIRYCEKGKVVFGVVAT